jgi:hypothetical protein
MPIPALTAEGFLPDGIHDCILEELRQRFGQFQTTDARRRLVERLEAFVREARSTHLVVAVIIDGSFVTGKDVPGDIDLIVVLSANHDFGATLRPFEYNVVSGRQIRRMHRIDALIGQQGEKELDEHIAFFSGVRGDANRRKGMLRLAL